MSTVHIAYETSTGRILLMHHGAAEADDTQLMERDAIQQGELSDDQVAMISLPADQIDQRRLYRVDLRRKTLIEAEGGEDGVSFSVGASKGGVGFGVGETAAPQEADRPGGSAT